MVVLFFLELLNELIVVLHLLLDAPLHLRLGQGLLVLDELLVELTLVTIRDELLLLFLQGALEQAILSRG